MSAANLGAVKKKVNLSTVAWATWRNPAHSVLPVYGGSVAPSVSPDSLAKKWYPTYKRNIYPVPEPTDDEDSEDDADPGSISNEALDDATGIDSVTEAEATNASEGSSPEQQKELDAGDTGAEPESDPADTIEAVLDDATATVDGDILALDQDTPKLDIDTDSVPEAETAPAELSPVLSEQQNEMNNGDTNPADALTHTLIDNTAPQLEPDEGPPPVPATIMEPEISNDSHTDGGVEQDDERRVSFAPGTPDPRTTSRRKKTAKGVKGKKKTIAVPLNEVPADIPARIDNSMKSSPPPALDPPTSVDAITQGEASTEADLPPVDDIPAEEISSSGVSHDDQGGESVSNGAVIEETIDQKLNDGIAQPDAIDDSGRVLEGMPTEEPLTGDSQDNSDPSGPDLGSEATADPDPAAPEKPTADLVEPESGYGAAVIKDTVDGEPACTLPPEPTPSTEAASAKPSKKKSLNSGKDKSRKTSSKTKSSVLKSLLAGLGIYVSEAPTPVVDDLLKNNPPPTEDIAVPSEEAPTEPEMAANDLGAKEGANEEATAPSSADMVDGGEADAAETESAPIDETAHTTEDVKPDDALDAKPDEEGDEVEADAVESRSAPDQAENPASSPADSGVEFEATEQHDDIESGTQLGGEGVDEDEDIAAGEVDEHLEEPEAEGPIDGPEDAHVGEAASTNDDVGESEHREVEEESHDGNADDPASPDDEIESEDNPISIESSDPQDTGETDLEADSTPAAAVDHAENGEEGDQAEPAALENDELSNSDESLAEPDQNGDDNDSPTLEPLVDVSEAGEADHKPEEPAPDIIESGDNLENEQPTEPAAVVEEDGPNDPGPALDEPSPPEAEVKAEDEAEAVSKEPEPVDAVEEGVVEANVANEQHADASEAADVAPAASGDAPDNAPPAESVAAEDAPPVENAAAENAPPAESAVAEDALPVESAPAQVAPPSPNLSKTSSRGSRKHKGNHWERQHKGNALKGVFEDTLVMQKSRKGGKEEVRVKDRARRSRHSSTEEDEARRRRRALRKQEEEARRAVDEERKRIEEDRARRARREERRAAREEAEILEKINRLKEEKESIRRQRDEEARRRGHRERDERYETVPSLREGKDAATGLKLPSLPMPKRLSLANAQSVHGKSRRVEGVASPSSSRHKDEMPPLERPRESSKESARPTSSSGSKSHRHRHSHRAEGGRSVRSHVEGDRRSRRYSKVEDEPPKGGLFSSLFRRR